MTAKIKKPSIVAVIIYVVVLSLLVVGLFAVLNLINQRQYSMNVNCSEGIVFSDNSVYLLPGHKTVFTVEYFDGNENPVKEDFSVEIVPANSIDVEVSYKIGESIKTFSFSDIENFNSYFSLEKNDNGFSIIAPEDFSVENAIKFSHPEKTVTILSEVNLSVQHFKVVVTSFDGEKVEEIYFDKYFAVEGVQTDSQIEFGGM